MPEEIEQAQLQAVRDALGDELATNLAPRFSEEDKRQLFLAAKAAGLDVIGWTDCYEGGGYHSERHMAAGLIVRTRDGLSELWNPRDFDGDALRLAVKLGLSVCIESEHVLDAVCEVCWCGESQVVIYIGENRLEATRRAIVRAAAEIGANMQS